MWPHHAHTTMGQISGRAQMTAAHFISGLPRSGSTLLAALLRQNPRFEAGMSGPLAGLFGALLGEMSARNEYAVFIDDAKRQRILHGLFDNYYAHCPAEVVFDTNRFWCAWMPAIARLFPDAKVIACVRDMPWVVDSIERLVQRNVFSPSSSSITAPAAPFTPAPTSSHRPKAWSALPMTPSNRRASARRSIVCCSFSTRL